MSSPYRLILLFSISTTTRTLSEHTALTDQTRHQSLDNGSLTRPRWYRHHHPTNSAISIPTQRPQTTAAPTTTKTNPQNRNNPLPRPPKPRFIRHLHPPPTIPHRNPPNRRRPPTPLLLSPRPTPLLHHSAAPLRDRDHDGGDRGGGGVCVFGAVGSCAGFVGDGGAGGVGLGVGVVCVFGWEVGLGGLCSEKWW